MVQPIPKVLQSWTLECDAPSRVMMIRLGRFSELPFLPSTGILSQLRAKLRDRAVRPVRAGCYFRAALSLTDSKTRYIHVGTSDFAICVSFEAERERLAARIAQPTHPPSRPGSTGGADIHYKTLTTLPAPLFAPPLYIFTHLTFLLIFRDSPKKFWRRQPTPLGRPSRLPASPPSSSRPGD